MTKVTASEKAQTRVGRTLLSAAFDFDRAVAETTSKVKNKPNFKSGGQKCPPYARDCGNLSRLTGEL